MLNDKIMEVNGVNFENGPLNQCVSTLKVSALYPSLPLMWHAFILFGVNTFVWWKADNPPSFCESASSSCDNPEKADPLVKVTHGRGWCGD
jgi:hypothetical protein